MRKHAGPATAAALVWLAACALALSGYELTNDQFDRISRARQIAQYGDLPFRDFFDPGYFLTEFSAAALQRLLGDNLLGDLILTVAFTATGVLLVFVLARRVSPAVALIAASLTALAMPRAYDFDKVLFYPLGIALIWRYIDRRQRADAVILGIGVVAAALFRYDSGMYIGAAAIVGVATVHATDRAVLVRRLGLLAGTVAAAALPFVVGLQMAGGFVDAAGQVLTYAARERARTRIDNWPSIAVPASFLVVDPAPPPRRAVIHVRWAPSVGEKARAVLESRHALAEGVHAGSAEDRTWSYVVQESPENLRALVQDPQVEDTDRIDRTRFELIPPEPGWTRLERAVPLLRLRVLPGVWTEENAAAVLYYVLFAVPIVALVFLAAGARRQACDGGEAARVLSLVVMCLALDIFILRDPIAARVGGMIGPAAVLGVWLGRQAWNSRARLAAATGGAVVLLLACWSLSQTGEWRGRLAPAIADPASVVRHVRQLSASPVSLDLMPNSGITGLVTYVSECTRPTDRVFALGFMPELYFFARRGFAGGMVVTFGTHWAEPEYQRRTVAALGAQSVPVVVVDRRNYGYVTDYPLLDSYFQEHYRVAGETAFGNPEIEPNAYRVLVRRDRAPTGTHPSSMPCLA